MIWSSPSQVYLFIYSMSLDVLQENELNTWITQSNSSLPSYVGAEVTDSASFVSYIFDYFLNASWNNSYFSLLLHYVLRFFKIHSAAWWRSFSFPEKILFIFCLDISLPYISELRSKIPSSLHQNPFHSWRPSEIVGVLLSPIKLVLFWKLLPLAC